jgi:hypothetical protein
MMRERVVTTQRDFQFGNRTLSVRAAAFNEGWRVRVFEGNRTVTAVIYMVVHDMAADIPLAATHVADASMATMHLVHELMTIAEDDVEEGRVRVIA